MRCTVRLTPPCLTSWLACSLYMLIITWSISTSLISRGTVVFGVVLKSSSDTVTCHLFVITLFHCNTKWRKKTEKSVCVSSLEVCESPSVACDLRMRKWPLRGNASSHKSLHDLYPTCVHHRPRLHTSSKTGNLLCSSLSRRQCVCWVEH